MAAPLVERSTGDVIPASDHNDVKDYIEDGTYRVNTLSLSIGGTEVVTDARVLTNITGDITQFDSGVLTTARGGTGIAFFTAAGPSEARVYTFPDAAATILYSGGALGTPSGGTLTNCDGLPVAGLANGTDGELITWDSDGVAAVVAAGDADQVLTSNGAGAAPTFQDAAGGASIFECTVGVSVGDYATLGAAITAGKTRILVIADTTETGAVTLPADCLIEGIGINKVSINMDTYQLTTAATSTIRNVKIKSAYIGIAIILGGNYNLFEHIYFDWTHGENPGSASNFIGDNNVARTNLTILNCIAALPGTYANQDYILKLDNSSSFECTINGFDLNTSGSGSLFIEIDGQRAHLSNINAGSCAANGLYLRGDYSTISDSYLDTSKIDAKYVEITNCNISAAFSIYDDYCSISNCAITNILTIANGCNNTSITGCYCGSTVTLTSTSSYITISDTYFQNGLTLNNDHSLLSNCVLNSTLTIPSTCIMNNISNCIIKGAVSIVGNDTTFTGCRVGADAGGGAVTITIDADANRTIISGCRTDAAISDSGTDTVIIGNVTY